MLKYGTQKRQRQFRVGEKICWWIEVKNCGKSAAVFYGLSLMWKGWVIRGDTTQFFETLEKQPSKQKTMLLEEQFSTKLKKWEYQIIPCYLENRVVRELCKRRTACICKIFERDGWLFTTHSFTNSTSFTSFLDKLCFVPNSCWEFSKKNQGATKF